MTKNILMERYEVHERQIARWKVQIIAYLLGDKYVCIINNLDPNATICRVAVEHPHRRPQKRPPGGERSPLPDGPRRRPDPRRSRPPT